MEKLIRILIVVVVITTNSHAAERESWVPSGYFSQTFQERYLGLRVSREIIDEKMLWNELHLNLPKNFFANAWWSYGLESRDISSNFADELDLTAGWSKEVAEKFRLTGYISYFNLYDLGNWWNNDMLVYSTSISKTYTFKDHSLTPEMRVEWISIADRFTHGSVGLFPNVTHTWQKPLGIKCLRLSHTMMGAWDDGFELPNNSSDGVFFRWHGGLHWMLTERVTLTLPGFQFLTPLTDPHDGRRSEHSLSTSLSYRF